MRDIKELDERGIPGGYIASAAFERAARSQGEALGFHSDHVLVDHPIQDRTDEELEALAEREFARIYALVCTDGN